MQLAKQELLTLPEQLGSPSFSSGVRATRSLVLCVCFVDRCLSFVLFFWLLCCLLLFDLWILITPFVSSNSSYIEKRKGICNVQRARHCLIMLLTRYTARLFVLNLAILHQENSYYPLSLNALSSSMGFSTGHLHQFPLY